MDDSEISVHDINSRLLKMNLFEYKPKACKRIELKSFLLGLIVTVTTMPISVVKAEQEDWLGVRDDLLGNPELM